MYPLPTSIRSIAKFTNLAVAPPTSPIAPKVLMLFKFGVPVVREGEVLGSIAYLTQPP